MKRSLSALFLLEETGAAERQGGGTLGLGADGIAAGGALDQIAATNGEVGLDGGPEAGGKRPLRRGRDDLGGRGREGGSSELPSLGKADPAGGAGAGPMAARCRRVAGSSALASA